MKHVPVPPLDRVTPESPLRLEVAAAIAYPDGSMTAEDLARAIKEQRLDCERTAGSIYVTLNDVAAMRPDLPPAEPGEGVIYVVGFGPYVKIGFTTELTRRLSALRTGAPERLAVYGTMRGRPADERKLHRRFAAYRLEGEWFRHVGEIARWIEGGCRR